MAITHHVQIRISTTGLLGGGGGADVDITLTSADYDHSRVTLASGDNTIAIPATAQGILFVPPTGNSNAILLKGDGGDTGFNISKTKPTYISLDGDGDDIILNAAAEIADCEIYIL